MNSLLKTSLALAVCFAALGCCFSPAFGEELPSIPKSPDDLLVVEVEDQSLDRVVGGSLTIEIAGYIVPFERPVGPEGPGGPGGGSSGGGTGGGSGYTKPPQTGDDISALYWIAIAVLLGCMFLTVYALANNDRNTNTAIVRERKKYYP